MEMLQAPMLQLVNLTSAFCVRVTHQTSAEERMDYIEEIIRRGLRKKVKIKY